MKYLLKNVFCFLIALISGGSCAQVPEKRPYIKDPVFDKKISRTISFTIPTIGVDELKAVDEPVFILDAREKEEFEISHIPNARYIGYKNINEDILADIPKTSRVVLYCSIGYRSEKIGEKMKKKGYSNVYNLYGSIFEWINQGNTLVDAQGQVTSRIHTYNQNWSQWITNEEAEKVW